MKYWKILILLVFTAAVAAFYFLDLGKYLTLESLKSNRARLTDLRLAHTVLFAAVFVLVYIVQTAFSLPGAPPPGGRRPSGRCRPERRRRRTGRYGPGADP